MCKMDSYKKTYFKKRRDGSLTFTTITIDNEKTSQNNEKIKLIEPVEPVEPVEPEEKKIIKKSKKYSNINPIDFIKNGSIVIKLCRNTEGMNFRFFYVNHNSTYLRWFSPSKKFKFSNIPMNQIVNVIKKPKKCFYKNLDAFLIIFPANVIHQLVLRISYLDGYERRLNDIPFNLKQHYKPTETKHLYIIFKNQLELDLWYLGLMGIIDSKNIKKYIPNNKPHKSKVELNLYVNDFYKYDSLINYHQFSKFQFREHVLYNEIKKHKYKIKKRFTKLKLMDSELQGCIGYYILPILQTSLKLALHCIQIFNDSGSQLCEEDLSRLGMWLYQMKIEYVVIKDIIKKLREKQLRIRNGRIDYIIPYI